MDLYSGLAFVISLPTKILSLERAAGLLNMIMNILDLIPFAAKPNCARYFVKVPAGSFQPPPSSLRFPSNLSE